MGHRVAPRCRCGCMSVLVVLAAGLAWADWTILDGSALTPGPGAQVVMEGADSLLELSAPGADGVLASAEFAELPAGRYAVRMRVSTAPFGATKACLDCSAGVTGRPPLVIYALQGQNPAQDCYKFVLAIGRRRSPDIR